MSLIARFDGMAWPVPGEALSELGHSLRYDDPPNYNAASVVEAYAALLALPQRERNKRVAQIRRAALIERAKETFDRLVAPTPDVTKGGT